MVRAVLAVVALALGRRKAAFALPHEVIPLPGTTEALSLNLYVKSSETVGSKLYTYENVLVSVASSTGPTPARNRQDIMFCIDLYMNVAVFQIVRNALSRDGLTFEEMAVICKGTFRPGSFVCSLDKMLQYVSTDNTY